VTLSVQVPVPLQAPLQPLKIQPLAGVAVSVVFVPELKLALQVLPQLIPPGLLVTVPPPFPETLTVTLKLDGVVDGGAGGGLVLLLFELPPPQLVANNKRKTTQLLNKTRKALMFDPELCSSSAHFR